MVPAAPRIFPLLLLLALGPGSACDQCRIYPASLECEGHVDWDGDGLAPLAGDCDDARGDVFPGAAERCDGRDDDCDGAVDEGAPPDLGRGEVCDDGVDNDCDGSPGACELRGDVPSEGADLILRGDPAGSGFSRGSAATVAAVGDVDGDGFDDLLIGAPLYAPTAGLERAGGAYLVYGGPDLSGEIRLTELGASPRGIVFAGAAPEQRGGSSVAGAGDVNGDGYGDLLIATAPASEAQPEATGRVFLFYGGPELTARGIAGAIPLQGGPGVGVLVLPRFEGVTAGVSLPRRGGVDLTGDAGPDLLLADPQTLASAPESAGPGCVYVLEDPAQGLVQVEGAPASFCGGMPGDAVGTGLAVAEDLTGDGIPDLVVGAPGVDPAGGVYVLRGPLAGDYALADAHGAILGLSARGGLGQSVAILPDLSGDGIQELLVSEPESGLAAVFFGPIEGTQGILEGDVLFFSADGDPIPELGRALAPGLDVNGDGALDLVLEGTASVGLDSVAEGAFLLYGPLTRSAFALGDDADAFLHTAPTEGLSAALPLGDLNGDGYEDVALAVPASGEAGGGQGSLRIIFGGGI